MSWLKELKTGDSVWWVPSSRYGGARLVEVVKVGRKWVTLWGNKGRVDINQELTGGRARMEQHYGSPDCIYRSEEAFNQHVAAVKLRRNVYEAVAVHGNLSDDQIKAIADLIGLGDDK